MKYADIGLLYVEATDENFAKYPEVKDGRAVLVLAGGEVYLCAFIACQKDWITLHGRSEMGRSVTHFAPRSLDPIGEHVAVECGVWARHKDGTIHVSGRSGVSAEEWIGEKPDATATVLVPVRNPPHGVA